MAMIKRTTGQEYETNVALEKQFGEIISKLEVKTKENFFNWLSFFTPSKTTPFKIISALCGNEIRLNDAAEIFCNAYYAIIDGTYRDDVAVDFKGITEEYFFRKGIDFARKRQEAQK